MENPISAATCWIRKGASNGERHTSPYLHSGSGAFVTLQTRAKGFVMIYLEVWILKRTVRGKEGSWMLASWLLSETSLFESSDNYWIAEVESNATLWKGDAGNIMAGVLANLSIPHAWLRLLLPASAAAYHSTVTASCSIDCANGNGITSEDALHYILRQPTGLCSRHICSSLVVPFQHELRQLQPLLTEPSIYLQGHSPIL